MLRDGAQRALSGADLILHAGDVGDPAILEALRTLAPVVAVRGNVDTGAWAQALPLTEVVQTGAFTVYMLHILNDLDVDPGATGIDLVVSGHSHKPGQSEKNGVLYVNPGSAGPKRFQLPVTVAKLDLGVRPWRAEFIQLEDGS